MDAKKSAPRPRKSAAPRLHPANRDHMVAVAAYFRAEQRNFAPGDDLRDWLEAEAEVAALLAAAAGGAVPRKGTAAARQKAAPKARAAKTAAKPAAKRKPAKPAKTADQA
jgi:hypothetical protein